VSFLECVACSGVCVASICLPGLTVLSYWLGPKGFVGCAQKALPIAVDTRPVRNRGYTVPEPGLGSGSISSGTAVSGGISAVGVLSAAAATAADLIATHIEHARGAGSISTHGSSSSGASASDSSAAAVGVRVSALLELQQLMLVMADAKATAASLHSQRLSGPGSQHQGRRSSSYCGDSSWQGVGNSLQGSCQPTSGSSSGVSLLLGRSWLASVLGAAMEALIHADHSLRRWVVVPRLLLAAHAHEHLHVHVGAPVSACVITACWTFLLLQR
jgi:hypothetical protein